MSKNEQELLYKGLKFTPVPSDNVEELRTDVYKFTRKLRLTEFFHDKEYIEESIVRNKSKFTPQHGRNDTLDTFIGYLNKFPIGKINRSNLRDNLNKNHRSALKSLRNNPDIIIKEADKGSAIVIMNKNFYRDNITAMLNDNKFYEQIPENIDRQIIKDIRKLVEDYSDITKKEKDYLIDFECKTSQLYGLPKIHKSQQILSAIEEQNSEYIEIKNPSDLKFRPIVAGPACPTHRLSNLIDILLKPFIPTVKSFVRDDLDFLNKIPDTCDENCILTTFDVVSLYSNIPHDLGREAISYWLNKYPEKLQNRFGKNFILDSLQIILHNNSFEFNSCNFKLNLGCPMGSKCSPNYAILVLGYLETKLYKHLEATQGLDFRTYIENNFHRYLDDCFLLWNPKHGNVTDFHQVLNSIHPNLQFTMSSSDTTIPFLDILVKKSNNKIYTDIYHKPTDTKQYLNFFSCHPRHTKSNIPFSLARRVCTIVSDMFTRQKRLNELRVSLLKRGYPEFIIDRGITRANNLSLIELRTPKIRNTETDIVTFINTYNPSQTDMFRVFTLNKDFLLDVDPTLKEVFKTTKFINSKRQAPNLKRILTRAKFTENTTNTQGPMVKKCNKSRCLLCTDINITSNFLFHKANIDFQIRVPMDCDSVNLIYVLTCNGCKEYYIGMTNSLRNRTNKHRSDINNPTGNALFVSHHIHECAKDLQHKFNITPFYKMSDDNVQSRLLKEDYFIKKYKPVLNK